MFPDLLSIFKNDEVALLIRTVALERSGWGWLHWSTIDSHGELDCNLISQELDVLRSSFVHATLADGDVTLHVDQSDVALVAQCWVELGAHHRQAHEGCVWRAAQASRWQVDNVLQTGTNNHLLQLGFNVLVDQPSQILERSRWTSSGIHIENVLRNDGIKRLEYLPSEQQRFQEIARIQVVDRHRYR